MAVVKWSRQDPDRVSPEFRLNDIQECLDKMSKQIDETTWIWIGHLENAERKDLDEPLHRADRELSMLEQGVKSLFTQVQVTVSAVVGGKGHWQDPEDK